MDVSKLTLAWLKRSADKFTWQIYKAPYTLTPAVHERLGASLERGDYIRRVTKTQTKSIRLGTAWLTWPRADQVKFEEYVDGKEDVIVTFNIDGEIFKYHLRPDTNQSSVEASDASIPSSVR